MYGQVGSSHRCPRLTRLNGNHSPVSTNGDAYGTFDWSGGSNTVGLSYEEKSVGGRRCSPLRNCSRSLTSSAGSGISMAATASSYWPSSLETYELIWSSLATAFSTSPLKTSAAEYNSERSNGRSSSLTNIWRSVWPTRWLGAACK